ncbi:MAG: hypothetical protein R3B68_09505 [Phycisphaerales bacterium]
MIRPRRARASRAASRHFDPRQANPSQFREARRSRAVRPDTPFTVEPLEQRVVLSAVFWDAGGGDRLWSNPLNWSNDAVPTFEDDVTIDLGPGIDPEMMVADLPVIRVNSLTLNETLVVNRGTSFNVNQSFDIQTEGALRINGMVNWVQGVWGGDLAIRLHPGGQLNVGASATPALGEVTLESDLNNLGSLSFRAGSLILNGVITVNPGKTFNLSSHGAIVGSGAIINHGLTRRNADNGTTTTIGVDLTNTDRLYLLRGNLVIGEMGQSTTFTNSGRVAALRTDSVIRYHADSSHTPARLLGDGLHEFIGGTHTITGDSFLGLQSRFTQGAEVIIAAPGLTANGNITFDNATLTIDGSLTLARFQFQHYHSSQEVFLIDSLVQGQGSLDIIANALIRGTTLNVDTTTERLQIGDPNPDLPGIALGPGVTFTSTGWLNFLSGRIDMAPDATFVKQQGPFHVYGSRIGGENPGDGTMIMRSGQFVRYTAVDGPAQTRITADVLFEDTQISGSSEILIYTGNVTITGDLANLRVNPDTGLMTIYDLDLVVFDNATLTLPADIESIGPGSGIGIRNFTNIPAIRKVQEVRGSLSVNRSPETHTFTFDADHIVNYGRINLNSSGGITGTLTTPIDNREGGTITVAGNRFAFFGLLNADNEFVNRGSIVVEKYAKATINIDQGGIMGTLVNAGTFFSEGDAQVIGSFRNAEAATLRVAGHPTLIALTISREMVQGGNLRIDPAPGRWTNVPVVAASYVGTYTSALGSGVNFLYLPNGAIQASH